MKIISREEALGRGLRRFFTGEPCRQRGHVAERYVKSWKCAECWNEKRRQKYAVDVEHAEARREAARRYRADNPNYLRDLSLRREYGITLAEKDAQVTLQGGCALCGTTDYGYNGPVVDHCHTTGDVRGILCSTCNMHLIPVADNGRSHLVAPLVRFYAEHGCWGEDWHAFEARRREVRR